MQQTNQFKIYEPSGVVPVKGVVFTLLIGGFGGLFLGMVYAYFSVYNPLFYIFSILGYVAAAAAPLVAGFFVGVVAGFGAMAGKVRSPKAVAVMSGFCGVAFLWTSWMFWLHHQSEGWTWDGVVILQTLNSLAGSKYYILFGGTVPAWAAWSVWGLEAAMILGGAVLGGHMMMGDPFCEACGEWAEEGDALFFKLPLDVETLAERLKAGDLQCLRVDASGASENYRFVFQACPQCEASNYMTVKKVETTFNDEGEADEEFTDVVVNLALSTADMKLVRKLCYEGKHMDERPGEMTGQDED